MKTLQVGEFKKKFSEVLDNIRQGEAITITFGKKKEKLAVLIPYFLYKKKNKRRLGLLEKKASFSISNDFKISDEEFLKAHLSDFEFLGFLPYDDALIEADLNGISPFEVDSPSKEKVKALISKL